MLEGESGKKKKKAKTLFINKARYTQGTGKKKIELYTPRPPPSEDAPFVSGKGRKKSTQQLRQKVDWKLLSFWHWSAPHSR